jgi:hypothetical protein
VILRFNDILFSKAASTSLRHPKLENEPQGIDENLGCVSGRHRSRQGVQLVLEFAVPFVKETRRTQDQAGLAEPEIASPTTDHLLMNQVYRISHHITTLYKLMYNRQEWWRKKV